MGDEVRLWLVGADPELREVLRASLDRESRLEDWLVKDISILDPGLLVIGRQVKTDFGGGIDILCMDSEGDLIVVELKRDKTPREVTAQGLDYASWAVSLSNERVVSIANAYFASQGSTLEKEFSQKFQTDLPETLNADHRVVIVGSELDDSSERIIRYLSDEHGVNINAARFQYFRLPDTSELVVRIFVIEPSEAALNVRVKGGGKRRQVPTQEEIRALAVQRGVGDLYDHTVEAFSPPLRRATTKSGLTFFGGPMGGRRSVAILNLFPEESAADVGLRYRLYKNRFAQLADLSASDVPNLLPAGLEEWIAEAENPGTEYVGFQGFFRSSAEIDRVARALR